MSNLSKDSIKMSIHQMGTENFLSAGKSLNINLPGIVLVFFKTEGCKGCEVFWPVFIQLSKEDRRVNYGIVDLSYHRGIIQMSKQSTTVIEKVPHLIIYVQGRPHARFTGAEKTMKSLKDFLSGVLAKLSQQPQQPTFIPPHQQNMYGGQTMQGSPYSMPDSQPPRQAGRMATSGAAQAHPSMQQQCDPDDDDCLLMPTHIIPHNMPWESDYKRMMGEI